MEREQRSHVKVIPVDQAVGTVLAHDITEIRPGQFKGPAFKKGYVVTAADIPHLRRLGKEHLYVLSLGPEQVHEDEAALELARALCGAGVVFDPAPSEGKIALKAAHRGLLKVKADRLIALNIIPDISCASRHNHDLVEQGDMVAATRVIPLVIDRSRLRLATETARADGGVFKVKAFSRLETGIVITGNEVHSGLIEDKFAPLIRKKLEAYQCPIKDIVFAPDDKQIVADAIRSLLQKGATLLMVAGGMSVDPDDVSRAGIAEAGARDVVYGTPVLPGAMFLYARIGQIPVLGLPACILFYRATVLDLILPRVLAGEVITRQDFAAMAHGGLCLSCAECRYPNCPFGK
jgi:hypothetical protein